MKRLFVSALFAACVLVFFSAPSTSWGYASAGYQADRTPTDLFPIAWDEYDCDFCHAAPITDPKGPHRAVTATTDVCRTCHWTTHDAYGPNLLFQSRTTVVCCACHDGTGGFSVYTLSAFGLTPGGSHRIEGTSAIPGGDGATGGSREASLSGASGRLGCEDCHSPHDNKTVAPFTHYFRYRRGGSNPSSLLLRQKPGSALTSAAVYGSDWCLGCHAGRAAGGTLHNHPVDSLRSGPDPFEHESVLHGGPVVPTPLAVASDGDSVFVADVGNQRIVQLSSDFSAPTVVVRQWAAGTPNGQISGLALGRDFDGDGSRDLMVTDHLEPFDATPDQVRYYRQDGTFLGSRYEFNTDERWHSLTANPSGTVAVSFSAICTIVRFWPTDKDVYYWNSGYVGRGEGIALSDSLRLYVPDSAWNRVIVFDLAQSSFPLVDAWPAGVSTPCPAGDAPGRFDAPVASAVAPDGSVYIADTGNSRIQHFSAAGAFLGAWGSAGTGDGQFCRPTGIAVAGDGTVYVADAGNERIQKFTSAGTFLGKFGSPGTGAGQFGLAYAVRKPVDTGNDGFLMADPRLSRQIGHAPVCTQCHEDARDAGDLVDGLPLPNPYGWIEYPSPNGTTSGSVLPGQPQYQSFPHEGQNRRMLVETDDDLCLNCHAPGTLP